MHARSALWRLFPPAELKATRTLIERFFAERDEMLCGREAKGLALSLAQSNAAEVIELVKTGELTSEQAGLVVIEVAIANALTLGGYHIYRGVLSSMGRDLRRLWNEVLDVLVERHYLTKEIAEDKRRELGERLKATG